MPRLTRHLTNISPDHALYEVFSHVVRACARHRSYRLTGARPFAMQRVWVELPSSPRGDEGDALAEAERQLMN
jgi:hypothetical protein